MITFAQKAAFPISFTLRISVFNTIVAKALSRNVASLLLITNLVHETT
jgi:hypothetical protein